MSTKRLTADERATYLIGQAVRAVLTAPKATYGHTVTWLAWKAYEKVLPAALTPEEVDSVMLATGCVGEDWQDFPNDPPAPEVRAALTECYALAHDMLFPEGGPNRELTDAERHQLKDFTRQIWRASRQEAGTA